MRAVIKWSVSHSTKCTLIERQKWQRELIGIKTLLCQAELKPATAEKTLANRTSHALVCRIDKELPPKQVF